MKKALTRDTGLYHMIGGKRVDGPHPGLSGNCTGLWGDCTGLSGDLDECEITDEERNKGIRLEELVK